MRVGVALSDPLGLTAQPFGYLARRDLELSLEPLLHLAREHEVATIVVGHPLLLSGVAGERSRDATRFAERLSRAIDVAVVLWDERLTTVQAERALREGEVRGRRRREVIDATAAAILLQSWLDGVRSPMAP